MVGHLSSPLPGGEGGLRVPGDPLEGEGTPLERGSTPLEKGWAWPEKGCPLSTSEAGLSTSPPAVLHVDRPVINVSQIRAWTNAMCCPRSLNVTPLPSLLLKMFPEGVSGPPPPPVSTWTTWTNPSSQIGGRRGQTASTRGEIPRPPHGDHPSPGARPWGEQSEA